MKGILNVKLCLLSFVAVSTFVLNLNAPTSPSPHAVFVASSPCDAVSRPLLGIPESAKCELIKWRLTLYHDSATLAPSTYELGYTYGLPEQGTNGLSQGGTRVERKGRWAIVRGAKASPDATVYQLDPDKPGESISFLKASHNLIHLLDRDKNLVVGNGGWSYTLNGAGDYVRHTGQASPRSTPASASAPTPAASASSVAGVFVGRSPCREVAIQLNRAVGADCNKLKWELTLYRDPNSLAPSTYKLRGTLYRERVAEGRWAITRGTKTDSAAVVYQLDPDKPHTCLLFLRADDNILLFLDKERNLMAGNADFSYTLNRAKDDEADKRL